MSRKNRTPAIAYLRTSSATNVGADRDSDKRQRKAIEAFAKRAGFDIVAEFYDASRQRRRPYPRTARLLCTARPHRGQRRPHSDRGGR